MKRDDGQGPTWIWIWRQKWPSRDRDDNASGLLGWANLPLVQTYEPSYHAFDSREIMKDRGMLYQGSWHTKALKSKGSQTKRVTRGFVLDKLEDSMHGLIFLGRRRTLVDWKYSSRLLLGAWCCRSWQGHMLGPKDENSMVNIC